MPTGQREHGQLAGKRAYETGHVAHGAPAPVRVVDEVHAAVVPVDHGDHQQVRAHQEVAQRQVDDQERVHLIGVLVLGSEHDHHQIGRDGYHGQYPDAHAQHNVGHQILARAELVRQRCALFHEPGQAAKAKLVREPAAQYYYARVNIMVKWSTEEVECNNRHMMLSF